MLFGEGDYRYEEVEGWAKLPEGWVFTAGVGCRGGFTGPHLRIYARYSSRGRV